jgi:hypothetical protein
MRAPHLRLIMIGGAPVGVTEPESGAKQYGGISAALDMLLTSRDAGGRAVSSDSEEARRLLRIGGRLRELAEQCLDPAAPALERLGRSVETSGRRRLLAVVSELRRPSGGA